MTVPYMILSLHTLGFLSSAPNVYNVKSSDLNYLITGEI